MITRRGFLLGASALAAAPAIVRVESIMPVRPVLWTPDIEIIWTDPGGAGDPFQEVGFCAWRCTLPSGPQYGNYLAFDPSAQTPASRRALEMHLRSDAARTLRQFA